MQFIAGTCECAGKKACSASVVIEVVGILLLSHSSFAFFVVFYFLGRKCMIFFFSLVALSQLLHYSIKAFTFRCNACRVRVSANLTDKLTNKILVSF